MFSGPRYGGLELSHCKEQWTAGFLGGSDSIEFICNVGDLGLSPGSERSPGEGNGWIIPCTVHGVTESDTTERLILPVFTQWTAINMTKHKLS